MNFEVIQGDCLEVMRSIPDGSIDACITDPPYGTTACSWDAVIPFAPMWAELKRVVKKNGAIVLFGSQPFTSALIMSNPQMFKYQWVWEKGQVTNFLNANKQPLRAHEDIVAFYEQQCTYNPQFSSGMPYLVQRDHGTDNYGSQRANSTVNDGTRHPTSLIGISQGREGLHPTQKPVELMRYLVRTYTNAGETVLDFTCGSGSTGVACAIEGRRFVGIEQDAHYAEVARARAARASGQAVDIPRMTRTDKELPLFQTIEDAA